ncbi:Uncharacterised protein [Acinetobacter baumannii]|nr:Uncharacterised protein [Acinetobacter baumannii]
MNLLSLMAIPAHGSSLIWEMRLHNAWGSFLKAYPVVNNREFLAKKLMASGVSEISIDSTFLLSPACPAIILAS